MKPCPDKHSSRLLVFNYYYRPTMSDEESAELWDEVLNMLPCSVYAFLEENHE